MNHVSRFVRAHSLGRPSGTYGSIVERHNYIVELESSFLCWATRNYVPNRVSAILAFLDFHSDPRLVRIHF